MRASEPTVSISGLCSASSSFALYIILDTCGVVSALAEQQSNKVSSRALACTAPIRAVCIPRVAKDDGWQEARPVLLRARWR